MYIITENTNSYFGSRNNVSNVIVQLTFLSKDNTRRQEDTSGLEILLNQNYWGIFYVDL